MPGLRRVARALPGAAGLLPCGATAAVAHTLVTPYDLPIPFAAYVFACAATLALTFAVLALVPNDSAAPAAGASVRLGAVLPAIGRLGALALLALAIVAGLCGTASPIANIAPALVWVGLMLGMTVLTALLGDFFQIINPWRSLLRLLHIGAHPPRRYPAWLACWPAFLCYLALAWLELMAPPLPSLLAWSLLTYGGLTAAGAALFGRAAWFRHAELFSVFFRVVGKLAPIAYRQDGRRWHATLRPVLAGTLADAPHDVSLLLFVLFMLAATTYDGVWQTSFWAGLYWGNLMAWLQPLWGNDLARAQALLAPGYVWYQRGGLLLAPFVYGAVYLAAMAATHLVTGRQVPVGVLARRFAFTLIPIAVVYILAHNWTLVLTEIPVVPFLLTDPLGIGWNLLGLPLQSAEPGPLPMGQVWHVEVALILVGHVASVYLAHCVAARIFATRRQVWLSELPMLVLMMGYTFIGLAVLSLPLALH